MACGTPLIHMVLNWGGGGGGGGKQKDGGNGPYASCATDRTTTSQALHHGTISQALHRNTMSQPWTLNRANTVHMPLILLNS